MRRGTDRLLVGFRRLDARIRGVLAFVASERPFLGVSGDFFPKSTFPI